LGKPQKKRPYLSRKHALKLLSCVGRKVDLKFPFAYLVIFMFRNLRIFTELFRFLRDTTWTLKLTLTLGKLPASTFP
jgi:hypothetical protein